ncbi:MAG: type II toxin-antitoxin system VapC family toxin [Candidatus Limnocylindrales bacterium]
MLLVVDTSVLIDHLRQDERAVRRLRAVAESTDELWSVTPVRTEIYAGARESEEEAIAELLAELRWLDVSIALADAAGRMAATYRRSHPGVDTVDCLLAAATQELGADLLTQNVKHFPMIAGLQPAY